MKFTPPEQTYQQKVWHEYTDAVVPTFSPHFISFLEEFKRNNGIITVVTQSESKDIYKAYQNTSIKPDENQTPFLVGKKVKTNGNLIRIP